MNAKRVKDSSTLPKSRCSTFVLTTVLAVVVGGNTANAQPGRGRGFGGGRGPGANPEMRADMTTLHALFSSRDKIKRTVKLLPSGAEATTEADNEAITALIHEHVPAMESRVQEDKPLPPMTFHPIFVELIKHADDYTLTYEETKKGVKVTYFAKDPFVIMLVQEHAKLVSRFLKNGMEEIHKPYTLPKTDNAHPQPGGDSTAAGESTSLRIAPRFLPRPNHQPTTQPLRPRWS